MCDDITEGDVEMESCLGIVIVWLFFFFLRLPLFVGTADEDTCGGEVVDVDHVPFLDSGPAGLPRIGSPCDIVPRCGRTESTAAENKNGAALSCATLSMVEPCKDILVPRKQICSRTSEIKKEQHVREQERKRRRVEGVRERAESRSV